MSSKPDKLNLEENEKIKTQIDASIGIARSLISSWLPPVKPGESLEDNEDDDTLNTYSTGRPDRLGLGAKFLSHADAMRHNKDGAPSSKEEIMLKNKILNQNRKATTANQPVGKRFRPQDQEDSDSDEESRSTTVGTKQKKTKQSTAANTTTPTTKKKIGNQGDFLSMYLNERAGKKKKNKK